MRKNLVVLSAKLHSAILFIREEVVGVRNYSLVILVSSSSNLPTSLRGKSWHF
jgi:hypothetical protein